MSPSSDAVTPVCDVRSKLRPYLLVPAAQSPLHYSGRACNATPGLSWFVSPRLTRARPGESSYEPQLHPPPRPGGHQADLSSSCSPLAGWTQATQTREGFVMNRCNDKAVAVLVSAAQFRSAVQGAHCAPQQREIIIIGAAASTAARARPGCAPRNRELDRLNRLHQRGDPACRRAGQ